tara:strand:+ start:2848 stop:3090 length:243 start_codon:yes stop_codon:yes gene_type:complete
MVKIWTATDVAEGNHDWDFDTDERGNITALHVKGSVVYNDGESVRGERYNVWDAMSQSQKDKVQSSYALAVTAFNNHFLT